jgi:hypothetical protein
MMVTIKYVPYGIANRFQDGHIELNEHLPKYPELHDAILRHELSHTDNPGFTKEDFILDLSPTNVNYFKLFGFIFSHPSSLFQFVPVYKRNNELIYDINMCIVWGSILGIMGLAIYLGLA